MDQDGEHREHPLLADRDRLDRVVWVMHAAVQKVFFPYRELRRPTEDTPDRVIVGGTSVEDVVQEALSALLAKAPETVESFEALGVDIAKKRAVDALRRAKASEVKVSSLDSLNEDPDSPPWWERFVGEESPDASEQYEVLEQQRRLWALAETLLDPRGRRIFLEVHYLDRSRAETGRGLDPPLTGQRVGQIYVQMLRRLLGAIENDPEFPSDAKRNEEEVDNDAPA